MMRYNKQVLYSLLGVVILGAHTTAALEIEHHDFVVDSNDHTACLDCHDTLDTPTSAATQKGCNAGINSSHPVDTRYPPPGKENLFNSRSSITKKGLLLADGKVTCLSCHNLRNRAAKHLAINNDGSTLCLTCHHT